MKLLMAQLNPTIGDLNGNTERILASLDMAREYGAEIVLFPEMAICGYPPEDLVWHKSFIDAMEAKLEVIAKASKGLFVTVGLVRKNRGQGEKALLNSAAIIEDGEVIGFQDKWLLPTY